MWAAPFAPPPDNTSPTLGRVLTVVVSLENAVFEISNRNTASIIFANFSISSSGKITQLFKVIKYNPNGQMFLQT